MLVGVSPDLHSLFQGLEPAVKFSKRTDQRGSPAFRVPNERSQATIHRDESVRIDRRGCCVIHIEEILALGLAAGLHRVVGVHVRALIHHRHACEQRTNSLWATVALTASDLVDSHASLLCPQQTFEMRNSS